MDDQSEIPTYDQLVEENRRLREQHGAYEDQIAALYALQDAARTLAMELNLPLLLKKILRSAVQVMDATAGSLLLLDPSTGQLVFEVIEGGGGDALIKQRINQDQGIAGWVATHCEPVVVADVTEDDRFYPGIDHASSFTTNSLLCVPLMSKGEVIGVLQLLNKQSGDLFDEDDVNILNIFASQSAAAIGSARLYEAVREERDRVVAVEEDVRRRLARDLHDSLAQLLAAALMNVRFMSEEVSKQHAVSTSDLSTLEGAISRALFQVRTMLFDLRPVILETQGLVAALEAYTKRLRKEGTGRLRLSVNSKLGRLSPKIETAAFSIIRESLNNVRRHARAKNIRVTLDRNEDNLYVTIEDDGQGFDVELTEKICDERGSIGLLNMREWTETVSGTLSVDSAVGEGTKITLTVPLYIRND
jgi:signal transduction histidine kinase